jgi:hypothetical protein
MRQIVCDAVHRYWVGSFVFVMGVITSFTWYLWHRRQSCRAMLEVWQVWQLSFFTALNSDAKVCGLLCS